LPSTSALNVDGLGLSDGDVKALFAIDHKQWYKEVERHREALRQCGDRMPSALWIENRRLQMNLPSSALWIENDRLQCSSVATNDP
jgi:GTP-dependent phosphoenolpyruvate carboxykinase